MVGMKLSAWLSAHSLTRSEFARGIGVGPSTITRIINGEREPSGRLMATIHHFTGGEVTVSDFYDIAVSRPTNQTVTENPAAVERT
jgi:transcriptional regulator with XRE-family HTH domain